jgi:uncharacterized coiled-coil protein SlyX
METATLESAEALSKLRLEDIVLEIGEAVLATTQTVDCLAARLDELANQVQQQGYQIFALSDEVQTLTLHHQETIDRLTHLSDKLTQIASTLHPEHDSDRIATS